ncbi:hypothetical protein GGR51DRAFT_509224 [Nemania sp. FL0031]|nr:hypothetical protein GGR51DRAFT_509224 [Nemania sp. FL0031]
MEVIGLVAAIPGLIEITRTTISLVRAFIGQGQFVKQITELLRQLESIEKILQEIQGRLKSSTIHRSNLNRLTTEVQGLKSELIALGDLLRPSVTSSNQKAKTFKRGRLLISGFEGKIKKFSERLDKANSALILVIVTQNGVIAEEILTLSRSNQLLKLRDVLLPCGYDFIPQRLQGTCEWIWSHPVFCQWQKGPAGTSPVGHEHRLLCIYGPKGCGKSVLAASIVGKLKVPFNSAVGFSFWAGSHNQQKLLAFLCTFLWHLIQRIPDGNLTQVSKSLQENIPLTEKALEDLVSLALNTIKSHVYCIIDGIDESVDDWTRTDTGGLGLILSLLKKHSNLRIVLLGRDASMRVAASSSPLGIEITEELVRPDINLLISHHLDISLKIRDETTRHIVQKTLQESSRVMFLWVSLIFGELNRCQLPGEIVRTLQQVPRDLDREYHRLFLRLQERLGGTTNTPSFPMERAKCLLSWIIAAPEPLTYEELYCAFAISQCPDEGYEQYFLSEDAILDSCGDFVRVSDGRYHVTHASITEFLTRPIELWKDKDEAINYFRIDVQQSRSQMCLECITYFKHINLGYPLIDESAALSHTKLPIFSCALKFALLYPRIIHAPEHYKRSWNYLTDFINTSQFHPLAEHYGLPILTDGTGTYSEPQVEILNFITWVMIENRVEQLLTLLREEGKFQKELARRDQVHGPHNAQFRIWKSFIDMLVGFPEGTQLGSSNVMDDVDVEETGMVPSNRVNRTDWTSDVKARRAAEHTAMMKIGESATRNAPVLRTLTKVIPKLSSVVSELLPVPLLILLAFRQTTAAREEQYFLSALNRLTGANNFLEAYCANQLGQCRMYQDGDKTAVGLLNRCRDIIANLRPSLHVDILHCYTLGFLAYCLLKQGKYSEAQEIVLDLERRLSHGPTKGYLNTPLERKLYCPLFWDDWKAEMLADVAENHLFGWDSSADAKALSMVDSNLQLYKDPGHGRVEASITAYYVKAWASLRLWVRDGYKIPSELADQSKEACRVALRLARFPNSRKYIYQQWDALWALCTLLCMEGRSDEAKELIAQFSTDFLPTKCIPNVVGVAATAACLGDVDAGKVLFERACMTIPGNQVSLPQSKSSLVPKLIKALIKVRPMLQLWPTISRCYVHCYSTDAAKDSGDQDYWFNEAREVQENLNPCENELWDILHLQGLCLMDHEKLNHVYKYQCFAFEYAVKQHYEAATIVSRSLISYALAKQSPYPLQWGLYFMALSLHFTFRDEEALAVYRSMLFWIEKRLPCEHHWLGYHVVGVACFQIGENRGKKENPLSTEFLKLALISFTRARDSGTPSSETQYILYRLSESRTALEELGISEFDGRYATSPKVNASMRFEDGLLRHQSCPDLRGRYFREVPSDKRAAYNLWRKQSIRPT